MASPEDVSATKLARSEFSKRQLDTTALDLRVTHGVCYIRGVVKAVKGGPPDVRAEVDLISKVLRQRPGIRDVIIDCAFRS